MRDPKCILITGASGGIGAALARAYARPGITLGLTGRNAERLAATVAAVRDAGAVAVARAFDLREESAVAAWVAEFEAAHPIDLAIANAGITGGHHADGEERLDEVRRLIDTNFLGACYTIQAALPAMRRRRRGQIAVISSLAGMRGLPSMPGYCASKAALIAYAEALRAWLRDDGIEVSIVLPGNVDTPMAARETGPQPMMMSADRAAALIRRGLEHGRARIAFPLSLYLLLHAAALMPAWAVDRVLNRMRITVAAYD